MGRIQQWGNNGMGAASPSESASLRSSDITRPPRESAPSATAVNANGSATATSSSANRTREQRERAKIAPVGSLEFRPRERDATEGTQRTGGSASERAAIDIAVSEVLAADLDTSEASLDASQRTAINLALSSDEEIAQGTPAQKDCCKAINEDYSRRQPTTRISDAATAPPPPPTKLGVRTSSGNALNLPSLQVPAPPPPAQPGAYAQLGNDYYRRGDRVLVARTPDLASQHPDFRGDAAANSIARGNGEESGLAEAFPVSDGSLHLALEVPDDDKEKAREKETQRKQFNQTYALLGCALLVVITVLAFVYGLRTKSSESFNVPTPAPTSLSPTLAPTAFRIDLPEYTTQVIGMDHNKTSPQSRAYQWILNDPHFDDYPEDRLLQRFALATLFYSTRGDSTMDEEGWAKGSPTAEVVAEKPPHKPKGAKPRPIPALMEAPLPSSGNITRNEANWLDYNVHECLWYNRNTYQNQLVETCDGEGRYKHLFLDVNNLRGTLCPELALLSHLQALGVAGNYIEGTLPAQLFQATPNMTWLVVEKNQFSGTIPSQVGLWSRLNNLRLMNNRFSGSLPSELFALRQMNSVMIGGNQLTGSIPPQMGTGFPNLVKLDMPDNRFTGTLPSQLGLLTNLRILDVYYNELTGPIPSQLGMAAKLAVWQMQANRVSGSLPSQLGLLEAMEVLNLEGNPLTGSIPTEMGPLAVSLDLPIPSHLMPAKPGAAPSAPMPEVSAEELGQLLYLQVLDIRDTGISGVIPTEYCNTATMEQLEFNCSATLCGCGCNCSTV